MLTLKLVCRQKKRFQIIGYGTKKSLIKPYSKKEMGLFLSVEVR